MAKIRIYVSHSIRGKYGKDATDEQMAENNEKAKRFAQRLRGVFPTIEFYVPGEHDEFVLIAYRKGILTEEQILKCDCLIINTCNLLINYIPDNYVSRGMWVENAHAGCLGIPVISITSDLSDLKEIHHYLDMLKRG